MARMAFDPVRDAILNSPERTSYPDYPLETTGDIQNGHHDQRAQLSKSQEPSRKSALYDDGDAEGFAVAAEIFGASASTPELMQNGLSSGNSMSAYEAPFKAPSVPSSHAGSSASPERRNFNAKLNTNFTDFSTPGGSAFPPTPGAFMNTPVDISLPSAYEENGRHQQPPVMRRQSSIFSLLTPEPGNAPQEIPHAVQRTSMDIPVISQDSERQRPHSQPVAQLKPSQPIIDKRSASPVLSTSRKAASPPVRKREPSVPIPLARPPSKQAQQPAQAVQKEPKQSLSEIAPAVAAPSTPTTALPHTVAAKPNLTRGRMYAPHSRVNGPPPRSIYEPLTAQEIEFYTDPGNCRNPLRKGFAGSSSGLGPGHRAESAPRSNSNGPSVAPPTASQMPRVNPATIDVTPQYAPSKPLDPSLQTRPIVRKATKATVDGSSPSRKRKRSGSPAQAIQISPDGAEVAAHYNKRQNISRDDRNNSPIIGLKSFNNWIKSVLIAKYSRCDSTGLANGDGDARPVGRRSGPPIRVLDLGCGKGGDLGKWQKAGLRSLVGVDIAQVSVQQARDRWQTLRGRRFPASFHALDAFSVRVTVKSCAATDFSLA